MIDPAQRYRDAGANEELATVLAKAEQELIERLQLPDPELVERLQKLEQAEDCDACQGQIDQLKDGIDSCQTQIEVLNRSMGELMQRLKNLEKVDVATAGRELDQPWGAGWPDNTPVELTLGALREIVGRLADLQETPEFLDKLRAAGVTRYKRGDLEIELGGAAAEKGVSYDGPRCPDLRCNRVMMWDDTTGFFRCPSGHRSPPPDGPLPPGTEPWPGAFEQLGKAVREAGYLERHPAGESPEPEQPPDEPPDEHPPVEIDMAAVEEMLREQDAKRRGPAQ